MPGVGKSELALQYATQNRQTYTGGICWVKARELNVGQVILEFATSRFPISLPKNADLGWEALVGSCWHQWPAGEVLLVIDDLVSFAKVKPFLPPPESRFHVLLTARKQIGKSIRTISLDPLDESQSLELLESLTSPEEVGNELDQAKDLCRWLGYLPLGIELTGRYLSQRNFSVAEVQQLLDAKSLTAPMLVEPEDEDMTATLGVASAFELSWEELPDNAKTLAFVLSLFAPTSIHWDWVELGLSAYDPFDLKEWRDAYLVKLHLLRREQEGIYSLHQLIWKFLQTKSGEIADTDFLKLRFCQIMKELSAQLPESPTLEDATQFAAIAPHAQRAIDSLPQTSANCGLSLFTALGRYYFAQGLYEQAANQYKRLCQFIEEGPLTGQENLATSKFHLADCLRLQGNREEARAMYNAALDICTRLFGEEHPKIADIINDLGLLLSEEGKLQEAMACYRKAFEIRQRYFEENSFEISESLNNIAACYLKQGNYADAEPLLVKVVAIRRAVLGEEHPKMVTSLNNLAYCYASQKKNDVAASTYKQAIDLGTTILGGNHPETLSCLNNLGHLLYSQEQFNQAKSLFLDAQEKLQELFNSEHPKVLAGLTNLAAVYEDTGEAQKAEELYTQVLETRERVLNPDNPSVAVSLNNLAKFYTSQGDKRRALPLYTRAVEILNKSIGPDHPITRKVQENLNNCQDNLFPESEENQTAN